MIEILTAELISIDYITRVAGPRVAQEGRRLHSEGRVRLLRADISEAELRVDDESGRAAQVEFRLSGGAVYPSCTCREAYRAGGVCKHVVAAGLTLRQHLYHNPPAVWKAVLGQAMQRPTRRSPASGALIFSLQSRGASWAVAPFSLAARYLPSGHGGDPDLIAAAIADLGALVEPKPVNSLRSESFSAMPAEALAAARIVATGGSFGYWYGGAGALNDVLRLLPRCLVYRGDQGAPFQERLRVLAEPARVELDVSRQSGALTIGANLAVGERLLRFQRGRTHLISREPPWLMVEDVVAPIESLSPAIESLSAYPDLRVPAGEEDELIERYLLPLSERVAVRGDVLRFAEISEPPQPRLYLSERDGDMVAELRFAYGPHELSHEKVTPHNSTRRRPGGPVDRIRRDPDAEQAAAAALAAAGLKRGDAPAEFRLRRGTHALDFLLRDLPRIADSGVSVFGEEALTSAKVNRARPKISFQVNSGIDWFDLQAVVEYGDQTVPLKDLRRAVRKREKYIKLADGSIGLIPAEWEERFRRLFGLAEEAEGGLRLRASQVALLDEAISGEADLRADQTFRDRLARLRSVDQIPSRPLPAGLHAELRPYQHAGYDWLRFLHDADLGGILADDMGTGKTVATLALLQALREDIPDRPADLIVMPRSLLFNWQSEAARFTPDLRVYVHADQGRLRDPQEFGQHHLVLTTYGVMLRDISLLRQYRFGYAILDESQAIKNPVAETSRAARALQSEHRLVLTGTPVENSAIELWSQLAFTNPGLLGSLETFRNEFVTQIERHQSGDAAASLRRLVHPFILRRTKAQVARDLPPRSEELLHVEMEPAQRKLYAKTREFYRATLLGMIDDAGIEDARLKVLEGLLRLRQICDHPRLVDEKHRGGSAKLELLIDTLETLRAEGHKALVFSQFVQMLTLVRAALDERGIPYAYLDGSTRNRQEVVEQFQSPDGPPVFLISLKAGGVGLNLTAADYVIHVDPWWNPAVEMQATDRTHRIGQTKPVLVYKLITRDTVEEKILGLQARKRALVEQLIAADAGMVKSLTRDDVADLFS
jgi:non-specific serine/threonine protein kinase